MKTNRFWRRGLRGILILVLFGAALFAMSASARMPYHILCNGA
jgi:hypothetical protein